MALIRIDWNPGPGKIRKFGALLGLFSLSLAAFLAWKGHQRRAFLLAGGVPLGAVTAALPMSAGRWVYKGWMSASFVMGSFASPIIMGLLYYGMVAPVALIMRLAGRDALRLKRPETGSYWVPLAISRDKSYLKRLF